MTTIPTTGPEAILAYLQSMDIDALEQEQRAAIASGSKTKRSRAVRLLNAVQGLRVNELTPADLMLSSVPVIPPQFRPFSVTGNTFLPGDSNEVYRDLLEYRRLYQDTEKSMGKDGAAEAYMDLARATKAAYGYGDSPNPKTRARQVKGFFKMVTGTNPKTSFYQQKMLSKPVDSVGRGVIVPDADLGMDDVGLPEEMAWKLFGNYVQRSLVRSGMPAAAALKHLTERTPMARKALDYEMATEVDKNGRMVPRRPVVITRSPAWHKFNAVGQRARIVDGDAIRINTFISEGQNADFDGDCKSLKEKDLWKIMNEIHYGTFEELLPRLGLRAPTTAALLTLVEGVLEVVSFVDGIATWLPVSHVHFHTAHGDSVKVTFNTGFDLLTTDDHGMMIYDEEMNLKQVAPQSPECRVVPVAKHIPAPLLHESVAVGSRRLSLDYDFGYVVGHYLGDGGAYDKNEHVRVMSDDLEHLRALPSRFGDFQYSAVYANSRHKGFRLLDKELWEWFRSQFGSGSFEKRVASWVYGSPETFRRGLLDGILSTDGHLKVGRSSATVCICLSNADLMDELAVLCRTLGVWCTLEASPERAARRLHLDVDDMPWLELTHPKRNRILGEVRNRRNLKVRQYTKLVPWGMKLRDRWLSEIGVGVSKARSLHSIFSSVYAAKGHASLLVARQFCATRVAPPSDDCLRRWWDLVHSTVTCCTLVDKVEVTEREPVTFDVTVPETHLTVGPVNGVVTHQTMSVHVPTTDEAVRDVREKMMASRMLWSIKDRSKTLANPKHEQILGLSMGQLPGGKRHKFGNDDDAMAAIERGEVDLNDDIEITN